MHGKMSRKGAMRRKIWCTLAAIAMAAVWVAIDASAAEAQSTFGTPVTIRVAGSDAINSATPFFVAEKQGYFKDAGLDVSFVIMGGGATPMLAALRSGEVDVGLGAVAQYMGDISRGTISGKIIGEFTDNNYVILGRVGITDIKQLKGKVFGVSSYNAGDQLYAEAVLGHYGIRPDDLSWIQLGTPASRLSALLAGKVDGIEMVLTSMPENGKSRVIVSADDSPVPFVSNGLFVRQVFLQSNKPALQRLLAAVGKGADWVRAHRDEALPACRESGATDEACKIAIDVAVSSKSPYTWSSTTRVNTEAIKAMIPIIAMDIPRAKDMRVDDFVDTSIAGAGN